MSLGDFLIFKELMLEHKRFKSGLSKYDITIEKMNDINKDFNQNVIDNKQIPEVIKR